MYITLIKKYIYACIFLQIFFLYSFSLGTKESQIKNLIIHRITKLLKETTIAVEISLERYYKSGNHFPEECTRLSHRVRINS